MAVMSAREPKLQLPQLQQRRCASARMSQRSSPQKAHTSISRRLRLPVGAREQPLGRVAAELSVRLPQQLGFLRNMCTELSQAVEHVQQQNSSNIVGHVPASRSAAAGSLPEGMDPETVNWAESEFVATTRLALQMVQQWPRETEAMTPISWRRDARVKEWAAPSKVLQRKQFEHVAELMLQGLQQGRNQPRPAEIKRSGLPAPLQLLSLWARTALDKAQTTAEVDAVATMLQSASVELTQMEQRLLVAKETAVAEQQLLGFKMRARVHKAQGNTELLAAVRKQIKSAKLRLRNAPAAAAASSTGGRMGSGHAKWAGLMVLESLSSRLKRLLAKPDSFDRQLTAEDQSLLESLAELDAVTAKLRRRKKKLSSRRRLAPAQTSATLQQLQNLKQMKMRVQICNVAVANWLNAEDAQSQASRQQQRAKAKEERKRAAVLVHNPKAVHDVCWYCKQPGHWKKHCAQWFEFCESTEFDWGTLTKIPRPPKLEQLPPLPALCTSSFTHISLVDCYTYTLSCTCRPEITL